MTTIPKNAKLVHKGIIFKTYQWKQKMFDGSFSIFEAIKRKPSSQIIPVTKEKKIIVLKEKQPFVGNFYGLVGGQVEDCETPLINAKKELLEETGMISKKIKLWKKESFSSKIIWDTYYFIANDVEKIQKQNLEIGEKIEVIELNFEEFIKFTQKKDFRNKIFKEKIFKMIISKNKLEIFKKELFEN